MSRWLLTSLFVSLAATAADRPARMVPVLPKAPALDGTTEKEFAKAHALKPFGLHGTKVSVRVAHRQTTLFLAVQVADDAFGATDVLEVMLHFPGAGMTAAGHVLQFGVQGKRVAQGDFPAPVHAQDAVTAAVTATDKGGAFEVAIPAQALPRFPATGPMVFDLCVSYSDQDAASSPTVFSNCIGASMGAEALRLPDGFRARLALKPPKDVEGLQARPNGWAGYGLMYLPLWVQGDQALTHTSLAALVTDAPVSAEKVNVNLPEELTFGKGRVLHSVLSGGNPYAVEGSCNPEADLRFALYVLKGRTAEQVLEWPAANCTLGRAVSVSLEDDGTLTVGYSNGAIVTFTWSGTRFERTEIG